MEIFPDNISYQSRMRRRRRANQVQGSTGFIFSNVQHADAHRVYDVLFGVRRMDDDGGNAGIQTLADFWESVQLDPFLFKDWSDFQSCSVSAQPAWDDITLTGQTGDDTAKAFQIDKAYTRGAETYRRTITRPDSGLLFGWSGVQKTETTDYTVDYDTGIVTATVPNGVTPSWGGSFKVPSVFLISGEWLELDIIYSHYLAGETELLVVEDKRG